LIGRE